MSLTKVLNALEMKSNLNRKVATVLVLKVLEKTKVALPKELTTFLVKRICRLRLDIRLFISLIWLEALLVGIPKDIEIWSLKFQIWDLQDQIWTLRFLVLPLFKLICYLQGFCEGTCFGIVVAFTAYTFIK
jgi:hypothetical protein